MRQYLNLLNQIRTEGIEHNDRTGVGTKSIFGVMFKHDLRNGFPLLTTKRLSFRWIAEELFWFLSGSTNVNHLRERCDPPITIWDAWATKEQCAKFGREEGDLGPIYGHQWRNFGATPFAHGKDHYDSSVPRWLNRNYLPDGIDQIRNLMDNLETNPNSRRLIVSGWNPAEADQVALPPCHTLMQFKYHQPENAFKGRLDLVMYQRSADVFLGVPYNIASYALLLKLVAACCGMEAGVYTHMFGDVHIYSNHQEQVKEQLQRTPRELPHLFLRDEGKVFDNAFDRLMKTSWENLHLDGYDPYPTIKAEVAV